jgi:VWFA-related protein
MKRLLSVAVAVFLAAGVASAGQLVAATSVHTVRIDAIAEDARGRFIDDLKANDFELREEAATKALDSAELKRADGPRLVAIYLDEYHVSMDAVTDQLRAELTRFVDNRLDRKDLLVVMKPLDSLLTIHLTEDRDAARRAIAAFAGRKGQLEPRNSYERNFIAGTPARIEAARAQVTLSALNALAIQLGTLGTGRKALVVVSEGVARPERRRGQEFMPTLDTVARSANRANVAIYAIDPRGESAGGDSLSQAIRSLAGDTDGQFLSGNLAAGLQRIADELNAYYLLTYRASHADDGKFHEVQVKVKRPGVRLRARKGFWAPSPDDILRAAVLARANDPPKPAAPPEPMRHVSPLIRPWFGLARGDNGKTRVTIVWEPTARVPGDRRRMPARVVLTALEPDGTALFEGPLRPTGPGTLEETGSPQARAVFDASPGRLRLRMSIQDVAAEVLDSDVRDLSVADFARDVAIGTPVVLRARNARERRLLDDLSAVPVASRDFSRAEHLLIRFPAYGPAGAAPSLSARLLNRLGSSMRDLTIAPAATPGSTNQIDLPLAGLAAGEYIIEITATSSAGEARDRIGFRVTS